MLQHHITQVRVCGIFQVWERKASLDRDLLFCGAAGRKVY